MPSSSRRRSFAAGSIHQSGPPSSAPSSPPARSASTHSQTRATSPAERRERPLPTKPWLSSVLGCALRWVSGWRAGRRWAVPRLTSACRCATTPSSEIGCRRPSSSASGATRFRCGTWREGDGPCCGLLFGLLGLGLADSVGGHAGLAEPSRRLRPAGGRGGPRDWSGGANVANPTSAKQRPPVVSAFGGQAVPFFLSPSCSPLLSLFFDVFLLIRCRGA
mmetsp:Transcript_41314/g.110511  ORF Transcript_41314/g.110511 Transcript_41314/m.110511 type:complete len:220 (-) Transcript_41314:59-718(-)